MTSAGMTNKNAPSMSSSYRIRNQGFKKLKKLTKKYIW